MGITSLSANGAASGVNPAPIVPGLHVSGASLAAQSEYGIDQSCQNMWSIIEACKEKHEGAHLHVNRNCLCDRDIISSWTTCHKCWDRVTYHSNGKRDLPSSPYLIDDVTLSLVQSLCDGTTLASVAPDEDDFDVEVSLDTDEEESSEEECDDEESDEEESDEESDDDDSDEEECDDEEESEEDEFDDEFFDDEEFHELDLIEEVSDEKDINKEESQEEDVSDELYIEEDVNDEDDNEEDDNEEDDNEENIFEEDTKEEDASEEKIDEEVHEEDIDEEDADEEDIDEEDTDEEEPDEDQLSAAIGADGVFGSHDCVSSGKKPISEDFDLASDNSIGASLGHFKDESLIINSAGKQLGGSAGRGKTAPGASTQDVDIFGDPARIALGHEYKVKSNANTRVASVGLVVLGLFAAWAM